MPKAKILPKREYVIHDYTTPKRTWGHDYSICKLRKDGRFIEIIGWGKGIKRKDYILLSNGDKETRYRFVEIEYKRDPEDMFWAKLRFAPRLKKG